ncbi:MAG: hypothetical protein AABX88_00175 [Nanoarchaeota archaeon]
MAINIDKTVVNYQAKQLDIARKSIIKCLQENGGKMAEYLLSHEGIYSARLNDHTNEKFNVLVVKNQIEQEYAEENKLYKLLLSEDDEGPVITIRKKR